MRKDKLMECVDAFAEAMKKKLRKKRREGYSGWDLQENKAGILQLLSDHVDSQYYNDANQEVDIANLAMMIWNLNGRKEG